VFYAISIFSSHHSNFVRKALITVGSAAIAAIAATAVGIKQKERAREELKEIVLAKAGTIRVLFHYTDQVSAHLIFGTQKMLCGPEYSGHLSPVRCPAGIYATEIPPWSSGDSARSLQTAFFGGNASREVGWFVAVDSTIFLKLHPAPSWFFPCPPEFLMPVRVFAFGPTLMD
jgi:hypothetical protein